MEKITKKWIKTIIICMFIIAMSISTVCADDVEENETEERYYENEIETVSNDLEKDPTINSRRYVVYDRKSKRVIYGKNEEVKGPMASTTKIMTATIVLEYADLNKEVEITAKAAGTGGSRLGLKKGDKITIRDLLYGLMLRSGNDAAVALAIEVGGSVEGFAKLMNEKATELGLQNTNFVTPHGLDNNDHYTTARELAMLTDYALTNDTFKKIVGTKNYTITINGYARNLNNTNELLGVLDGVVGVKTGFTNGAGRCLVTETIRGDKDLITVVLGADTKKDRTKDSIKLINFAFNTFKEVNIEDRINEVFNQWTQINSGRIKLIKAKDEKIMLKMSEINTKNILLQEKDINNFEYEISSILELEAPIKENIKVGTITIKINNEIIEEVDILCKKELEKKEWQDYIIEFLKMIKNNKIIKLKS